MKAMYGVPLKWEEHKKKIVWCEVCLGTWSHMVTPHLTHLRRPFVAGGPFVLPCSGGCRLRDLRSHDFSCVQHGGW